MARGRERGLSLVELLVGAAVGSVVAAHQGAARRVQLEARLMQELRGAAELVSRDLRRAGHWAAAASGVRRGDEPIIVNPHAEITAASGSAFDFATARSRQLGARNWQALSDPGTAVITSFSVVPRVDEADLATFCARPCNAGSTTCPPRQQIRSYAISVAGRSAIDARVTRELRSAVRVRNDVVVGSCEA